MSAPTPEPKVALALGGGGARGLAHVGVLDVLVGARVPIDRIFGVSVGSIVGAAFAFEPDLKTMLPRSLAYLRSPSFTRYTEGVGSSRGAATEEEAGDAPSPSLVARVRGFVRAQRAFQRMITSNSLLDGAILRDVVDHLLPDADVADAKIPLTIVAVDLVTGREVEITRGPVRQAVLGSASLPGIFPPVPFGGCLLADVGVVSAVPCHAARRSGADVVVAVDVAQRIPARRRFGTAVDILLRMEDITSSLFRGLVLREADAVIRPDVAKVAWTDFSTMEQVIAMGRVAAEAALPSVVEAVRAGGRPAFQRPA